MPEALQRLLTAERDAQRQQRWQALSLPQTQQARTRLHVARRLGVSRNTVGRWLAAYTTGGILQMLTMAKAPGEVPLLADAMREALRQRLAPRGAWPVTQRAGRGWGRNMACRWPIKRSPGACALPCAPNSRCPGKRLETHPEQASSVQAHCSPLRQDKLTAVQALPSAPTELPVHRLCQQESRFGVWPIQRRRVTPTGVNP
jgi:Homeodomain-like domain